MIGLKELIEKLEGLEWDNKKIFLIALICLIGIYFDFSFILKLQLAGIKDSGLKISRINEDIKKLQNDSANMQLIKNNQLQGASSKVKKAISEEQVAGVLQDISNLASENNIKISQMRPIREIEKNKLEPGEAAQEKLIPLLISLDLSSDYHRLGSFINGLENLEVLIAVHTLKIAPAKNDYLNKHDVALVLRAYISQ